MTFAVAANSDHLLAPIPTLSFPRQLLSVNISPRTVFGSVAWLVHVLIHDDARDDVYDDDGDDDDDFDVNGLKNSGYSADDHDGGGVGPTVVGAFSVSLRP